MSDPLEQFAADPLDAFSADSQQEDSFLGKTISQAEFEKVSRESGVPVEQLQEIAPMMGGVKEGADIGDKAMALMGLAIGEGATLGVASFAAKKLKGPAERAAIDKLRALIEAKRSGVATAVEIGGSLLTGGGAIGLASKAGKAAKLGKAARLGLEAGVGGAEAGTYTMARSKEGEELEEFGKGFAFGAGTLGLMGAAGPAAKAGFKQLQKLSGTNAAARDAIVSTARQLADDVDAKMIEQAHHTSFYQEMMRQARSPKDSPWWQAVSSFKGFQEKGMELPAWIRQTSQEGLEAIEKGRRYKALVRKYGEEAGGEAVEFLAAQEKIGGLVGWMSQSLKADIKHKDVIRTAKEIANKLEDGALDEAVETFRRMSIASRGIENTAADLNKKMDIKWKGWRWIADDQFALQDIEERTGLTDLLPAVHKLSTRNREFEAFAIPLHKTLNTINKKAQKAGIDIDDIGRALNATPEEAALLLRGESSEFRQIYNSMRHIFEGARKFARQQGSRITKLEGQGYLPAKHKQGADLVEAFELRLRELGYVGEKGTQKLKADLKGLKDLKGQRKDLRAQQRQLAKSKDATDEIKRTVEAKLQVVEDELAQKYGALEETRRGIEQLTGLKATSSKSFRNAIDKLGSPTDIETRIRNIEFARAATKRGEKGIPDFMREYNPLKLSNMYMRQNVRSAMFQKELTDIMSSAKALRMAGHKDDAAYLETLFKDIMGVRTGTFAYAVKKAGESFKAGARRKALNATTPKAKHFWTIAEDIPDMMSFAMAQMYPFYMGMRVDNYVRNLTQPFALTAGELASKGSQGYGYGVAFKSYAETFARQLDEKQWHVAEKALKKKFLVSPKQRLEQIDFMKDGLKEGLDSSFRSKAVKKVGDWIDAASQASMHLYVKSDIQNRFVTMHMAKNVTNDLMAGKRAALDAVRENFPLSYQRKIEKAIAAGDEREVGDLLETYLLSRTQFNYDRISLSEFGRTMGGMFSMFSKWPSSVAGEIGLGIKQAKGRDLVEQIENASKGLVSPKSIAKWWGPLIAFMGIEAVLPEAEESKLRRLVAGRSGLQAWAPITSAASLKDISSPPVIDATSKIVRGITSGGFLENVQEGKWAELGTPFAPMVPGGVYYRWLTRDLEEYID